MRFIIIKILNILAGKILSKYNPVVIGITGSVGKSSTKKAIYEILKNKYKVAGNDGRFRTDLNIPLAIIGEKSGRWSVRKWIRIMAKALALLVRKKNYADILILEMGVDRPNDMKNMLEVVKPNIGILTGIGKFPPHTKYFRNAKHIAREKAALIKSLGKKDLAVLNYDDEFTRDLSQSVRAEVMTYGFDKNSTLRAEEIFLGDKKWRIESGSAGMSFKISYKGTTVPFRLAYVLGRGQIYAVLSAVAIGIHFGLNLVEMSEIISSHRSLPGRMKLIEGLNSSLIIDDTFNANPSSALSALETIRKLDAPRKIAVLGDMLELGEYCESGHREVGKQISKSVNLLFTYGSRSKIILKQAQDDGLAENSSSHFEDSNELVKFLRKTIKSGDIVLVKGSRAMHMEKIVSGIMAKPELAEELLVS
jgi:UDP-N-acetylmuramoyl-tripeptide--D-alanyl-D-alanine ligase